MSDIDPHGNAARRYSGSMNEGTANEDWLAELSQSPPREESVAALRGFLRRGLAKALARRSLHDDDLDDFAQEGSVKVLERLPTFRGDSRFTTWALSVAIRCAFTAMRRKNWGTRSLEDMGPPGGRGTRREPAS